jgi:hypothetical protein
MKTETKTCPRCGKTFECNNYNIMKCQCILVPLNADARQMIAERYDDCLCLDCLNEYSKLAVTSDIND